MDNNTFQLAVVIVGTIQTIALAWIGVQQQQTHKAIAQVPDKLAGTIEDHKA